MSQIFNKDDTKRTWIYYTYFVKSTMLPEMSHKDATTMFICDRLVGPTCQLHGAITSTIIFALDHYIQRFNLGMKLTTLLA